MIVILAAVFGALIGYRRADQRGGNRMDKAQYAAAHAIAFAIVGLFATLLVERMF